MKLLIKNAIVNSKETDIAIENGKIVDMGSLEGSYDQVINAKGLTLLPAFVDIHTHLREPGFEYKEDIASGSKAGVAGGYASLCCMPNTKPVIDNKYIVNYIINKAKEVNLAKVYPIGAITIGLEGNTMSEMGKLKEAGIVAVSDDGSPVESAQMMRLAMEYAKDYDLMVCSHCEEKSMVDSGVANEGINATKAGLKGVSRACEEIMVSREIILSGALNTKVHICHISTEGSVYLVRDAKKRGIKVSCETCPHYFAATDDLILDYNTASKVNPPLREEKDRLAIIQGLADGTIDAIATDHAPHSKEDKAVEYNLAANGISGLETAFSLAYTTLVDSGIITLAKLSQLMTDQPAKLFNLPYGEIKIGGLADLTLVDLNEKYTIDKNKFYSKGKNTPFDKLEVKGKVKCTIVEGDIKFNEI